MISDRLAEQGTDFGLLCNRTNGAYYVGDVDSTGRARIEKIAPDGSGQTLAEAPLAKVDKVGRQHLRLECVGDAGKPMAFRFLVNGTLAVEANDPAPLPPGAVGLAVHSHEQPFSQVVFDNFFVRDISASGRGR